MECERCKTEIGNATYCGCGWKRREEKTQSNSQFDHSLGYERCAWRAQGEQCRYPGTASLDMGAHARLYCSLHFMNNDAALGASIVKASMTYKHQTQQEKDREHQARADAYCAKLGLDTTEKKRAWVLKTVREMSAKMRPSYLDDKDPLEAARESIRRAHQELMNS